MAIVLQTGSEYWIGPDPIRRLDPDTFLDLVGNQELSLTFHEKSHGQGLAVNGCVMSASEFTEISEFVWFMEELSELTRPNSCALQNTSNLNLQTKDTLLANHSLSVRFGHAIHVSAGSSVASHQEIAPKPPNSKPKVYSAMYSRKHYRHNVLVTKLFVMAESGKKTRGKQVIELKRIEDDINKAITFSKCKSGIFKKASELATLTGAKVGVVMFSSSGKPYSFGDPSIEDVFNLFMLEGSQPSDDTTNHDVEAYRRMRILKLVQNHNDLIRQLDDVKEHGKMLKEITKGKTSQGW
ncbi:hypothetical protein EZV62_012461 [Acer yangbiense]|uniref:MADS-box domain-containing protein n=1 Tax=Acer yangbiense TaxID=1000413 RepID=A0A5C7HWC4_9ROSI|nr:hypothetical protein EZV62_012461 [Acer yangbiense]